MLNFELIDLIFYTEIQSPIQQNTEVIKNNNPDPQELVAIDWFSDEKYLQDVRQKIASYLEFLHKNPVEEPEKNPRLLKAYEARKNAAAMMLIVVNTAHLRPLQETVELLQDNTKIIEKNRPGLLELGLIGWLKNFFNKSEMTKVTDETVKSTKDGLKDSFIESKNELEAIKDSASVEEPPRNDQQAKV